MDSQAFRPLAIAEFDSVYRMAMHLARNPDQAAELVQETYLRAFQAEGNFQLRDHGVKPWLFKILHNVYYSKMGKQRREQIVTQLRAQEVPTQATIRPGINSNLESLDWDYIDERLKHAIERLPDHYREVIMLWAVEGLKYREIANVTDVALGTVMSRLYRARAILSERLASYATEHGHLNPMTGLKP